MCKHEAATGILAAFLLGIASAASLGLGAATARIWKPTNFILGLLTAFGAGALLSAVTIDIVAPSLDVGKFGWLAGGAVGMREQEYGWRSISVLWGTVILVTGIGAALGSVVFLQAPEQAFAIVEGLAAEAMLTVITQAMMPEALQRSGGFVGLAALAGFLFTTLVGV